MTKKQKGTKEPPTTKKTQDANKKATITNTNRDLNQTRTNKNHQNQQNQKNQTTKNHQKNKKNQTEPK